MTPAQKEAVVAGLAVYLEMLHDNFRGLDADQRLRVTLLAATFTNDCRGMLAGIEQEKRLEQEREDRERAKLKGTAGE